MARQAERRAAVDDRGRYARIAGHIVPGRCRGGEVRCESGAVLTVFMDDETGSSFPWVVGEDHDRFIRTNDGWRFASRRWEQLFARPGA